MGYAEGYNTIKKVYSDEIREKKQAASGCRGKKGKRGYVGKLMFPSDFMSRKERKEYMKASEVRVGNIYEDINKVPSFEEFQQMEFNKRKGLLVLLRELHTNRTVWEYWKIPQTRYYSLLREHGIELRPPKGGWNRKKEIEAMQRGDTEASKDSKSNTPSNPSSLELGEVSRLQFELMDKKFQIETLMEAMKEKNEELKNLKINSMREIALSTDNVVNQTNGFKLQLTGTYDANTLQQRIQGLLNTLLNDKKYFIKLEVNELEEVSIE